MRTYHLTLLGCLLTLAGPAGAQITNTTTVGSKRGQDVYVLNPSAPGSGGDGAILDGTTPTTKGTVKAGATPPAPTDTALGGGSSSCPDTRHSG